MIRKRSLMADKAESTDINISPLIDVVFILLIFFIVTAVFVEDKGIELNNPKAASAQQLDRKSIFISINKNSEVIYRGKVIGSQGVKGVIHSNKDKPVVIKPDELTPARLLIEVMDNARLAGATSVSIATKEQ